MSCLHLWRLFFGGVVRLARHRRSLLWRVSLARSGLSLVLRVGVV